MDIGIRRRTRDEINLFQTILIVMALRNSEFSLKYQRRYKLIKRILQPLLLKDMSELLSAYIVSMIMVPAPESYIQQELLPVQMLQL